MRAFEYARPSTVPEALALLSGDAGAAAILAGGTDLISLMKDDILTPRRVVSLGGLGELAGVRPDPDGGIRIGAMTTLEILRADRRVREGYAALARAAEEITSPQIRNVGTVGGNLLQRPRCWYFRAGFGLFAQRDGRSLVQDGDNRYHAILGNSGPAKYVHPSSLAPALIAFGATARLVGPKGSREVPVGSLFRIPTRDGELEHTLSPGELLAELVLPAPGSRRSATYQVKQREIVDWPLVGASVTVDLDGSRVRSAAIVLGHVAPIPWVAQDAARGLAGKTLDEAVAKATGESAVAGATPLSRNAYKVRLARVAVERALLRAIGREV
jgi:xanthine dehydrogenase YagS FAD-binding subunit